MIRAATEILKRRYRRRRHEVGAAVLTRSGRIFAGVHTEASVGSCDICAEWAAISMAVAAGEEDLEAIVAVRWRPGWKQARVVPPCGTCRELISDFGDVAVIYRTNGTLRKSPVSKLLPSKYWDNKR